jgi:hypothetical protein
MNSIWKKLVNRFVNYYQSFAKEKVMEEISNEVLLLAQQLDLEIDTEDTDQPVQKVEAQKITEEQETEKQPTRATGSRKICRKFLKIKKGKLSLFTP